jgi:RNA polymerase sigma factor (TIGR02999 family)
MTIPAAELLPQVYEELCMLSRARIARLGPRQALSPIELVHEAYLRVATGHDDRFEGRRHFFFAVSRAMHDILVEGVRRDESLKRGGEYVVLSGAAADLASEGSGERVLELALALRKLARKSAESAHVVLLCYFAGLTHAQIATVLGLSLATVERRCRFSREWLRRELSPSPPCAAAEPRRQRGSFPAVARENE